MKKLIFTLMMMAGLAMVAGTAMGQTNTTPYQGGKYTYTVNPIEILTAGGTATISFIGFDAPPAITEPTFDGAAATGTSPTFNIPSTDEVSFSFKLEYGLTETPGVDSLVVTVTEGGASGCSNLITLAVTVTEKPSLTLTLAASTPDCPNTDGTTVDGSADGIVGATSNTFTYTVTPNDMTGISDFDYTFALDAYTFSDIVNAKTAGDGTGGASANSALSITDATNEQTITITYSTVEGAGTTLSGTLSAATFTLPEASGGGTYNCTIAGSPDQAIIKDVPTIGTFQ